MGAVRLVGLLGAVLLCNACAMDDSEELSTTTSDLDISQFVLPSMDAAQRTAIVREYDRLDPTNIVPRGLLEDAILYFDVNKAIIPKTERMVVIDMSKYSGLDRFWLVDLASGTVEKHKVAHGDGSDPDNNGYADSFGNVSGSNKTSLGFYLTGEIYDGTHIHSMKLDGLSPDGSPNGMANTNARARAIVMHEAAYVNDDNASQQGRSNGCPAIDTSIEVSVVDRLHDGSLVYIATSSLAAPVGRSTCGDAVCDGGETEQTCAADCALPAPDPDPTTDPTDPTTDDQAGGGCSTGASNGSLLLALGLFAGLRRRRR
ncbi:MAG TPA: murein L,D-transpeptidase catalytic domain family protein [Kofleriaceae bacterium]